MKQKAVRMTEIATSCRPGIVLQFVGLLVFLASMPLNVLNGDGRGMIADPDHFQGWEVVWLGFWASSLIVTSYEGWRTLIFLPIAVTSLFTLAIPFVNSLRPGVGSETPSWLKAVGMVSFALTTFFFVSWAFSVGAFLGAVVWLGGAALVVFGAFYQSLAEFVASV